MPTATRLTHPSAYEFIPPKPTLTKLWQAAQDCRACELYKLGTQAVLGEGPRQAAASRGPIRGEHLNRRSSQLTEK